MGDIKLAISGQQLGEEKSLEEILSILNNFSVSYIELWTFNLIGKFEGNRCKEEDLEQTKAVLKSHRLGVACVTNGGAYSKEMAQQPTRYIKSMKETINVAKEVGARFVNCYAYYFALGQNADIARFVKVMRPLVKYAEGKDVTIVLENEAHDASGTPEGLLRILKALESDRFKTNFDPTNYYHGNVEPFPYAYEVLKEHIAYVHVKNGCRFIQGLHPDYMKGTSFAPPNDSNYICYTPIPDGAVNIEGFLARLERDGYRGFCTLEPHVETDKLMDYYKIDVSYMKNKGIK